MEDQGLLRGAIEQHFRISDEQFRDFLSLGKERRYKKSQFLVPEGSTIRKTHFINKGAVIAYFVDNDGVEHVVQFAVEGWWISDIQSYLHGKPAVLNVQAIEDCELYEFRWEDMLVAFNNIPPIQNYFLKITQNAFASFQERMLLNLSAPAEERYKAFCDKYPQLELRFPQKLIASYIGVTPEFLSRMKKSLLENRKRRATG